MHLLRQELATLAIGRGMLDRGYLSKDRPIRTEKMK